MIADRFLPHRHRILFVAACAAVFAVAGAGGLVAATRGSLDEVRRAGDVDAALSPPGDGIVNFLVVGSDSREGIDVSDPDNAAIGSASRIPGQRSDSLIVVRWEEATGDLALMSVPRDLWVRIGDGGQSGRVNAAYREGPAVLVTTVRRALSIPIHHYVEVGFLGFRSIVDGVGGVRICTEHPVRDLKVRLELAKGCSVLGGVDALKYVRSRQYERLVEGNWQVDGTGDEGRSTRQRAFVSALVSAAVRHVAEHPMDAGRVMSSFVSAATVDGGLDLLDMVGKLRPMASNGATSYRLPVDPDMTGGAFRFLLSNDARPLLAYFAGTGPAPAG